ncbi:4a-hydroxytetrahydrobiopterin dehydratase [Patescibacteria group bacterium]
MLQEDVPNYLTQVPGWEIVEDGKKITRDFTFKNFKEALKFINDVSAIAEREGHHPNLDLHEYKYVRITNYTHAIGGLHENDFILAAKINELITN